MTSESIRKRRTHVVALFTTHVALLTLATTRNWPDAGTSQTDILERLKRPFVVWSLISEAGGVGVGSLSHSLMRQSSPSSSLMNPGLNLYKLSHDLPQ